MTQEHLSSRAYKIANALDVARTTEEVCTAVSRRYPLDEYIAYRMLSFLRTHGIVKLTPDGAWMLTLEGQKFKKKYGKLSDVLVRALRTCSPNKYETSKALYERAHKPFARSRGDLPQQIIFVGALDRLEARGLVESDLESEGTEYRLTETGAAYLRLCNAYDMMQ